MDFYVTEPIILFSAVLAHSPQVTANIKLHFDSDTLRYGPYGDYGLIFVFLLLIFWLFTSF